MSAFYCYELRADFGPGHQSQKIDYIVRDRPINEEEREEIWEDWCRTWSRTHGFEDPVGGMQHIPVPSLDYVKREINHQERAVADAQRLLARFRGLKLCIEVFEDRS